jgi:hypothetical protein
MLLSVQDMSLAWLCWLPKLPRDGIFREHLKFCEQQPPGAEAIANIDVRDPYRLQQQQPAAAAAAREQASSATPGGSEAGRAGALENQTTAP